jgi:hypothetical protein
VGQFTKPMARHATESAGVVHYDGGYNAGTAVTSAFIPLINGVGFPLTLLMILCNMLHENTLFSIIQYMKTKVFIYCLT